MTVYTDKEAGQELAAVLEEARRAGAVRIRRQDGQEFILRPLTPSASPLDIKSLGLDISPDEIVRAVREGRDR
jgi:hypothetical protein